MLATGFQIILQDADVMDAVLGEVRSENPATVSVFSPGLLRAFLCSVYPQAGENSALLPDVPDLVSPPLASLLIPLSLETTVVGNTA